MQVLAVGLVGLALGVATFGIGLALKGLKGVTWKEMLMLPLMIPLIAGGIVLASMIFQAFEPIKNPLQLLIGSAVIGLSLLMFAPSVRLLGQMKLKDVLQGVLMILPLSWAIVQASIIFDSFVPLKEPLKLGLSSLAMGISILIFTPAVLFLGKLSIAEILQGAIGILAVAGAIVATAYIFSLLPNEMLYPSFMWTLGAGLSILAFGAISVGLGLIMAGTGGLGFGFLALGMASILLVAGTIVATSYILAKGDYSKHPSLEWSLGVGASLLIFSVAAITASVAGLASAIASLFTGGDDPLVKIAKSMVEISEVLQKGKWDGNYPKYDWALGVGTALTLFAGATIIAGGASLATSIFAWFDGDEDPLMTLAVSMTDISNVLQKGKWDGNYPKYEWALGVGTSLTLFAGATIIAGGTGLATSIFAWFDGDEDPLMSVALSMVDISNTLQKGNWGGNYPKVEWALGVGTSLTLFATATATAGGMSLLTNIFAWFDGDNDPLMSVALSMVDISKTLQDGNWAGNYPKLEWSAGVGTALTLFATATATAGGMSLLTNIFAWFDEDDDPLMKVTKSMVDISKKLQEGNWGGNYPKLEWSAGVGTSLTLFATATATAGGMSLLTNIFAWFDEDNDPLMKVAKSMVEISKTLQDGNWVGNYPKLEWASGVGTALVLFSTATATAGGMSLLTNIFAWFDEDNDPLMKVAKSMVDISKTLQDGNWAGNYPKLEWSAGVGTALTLFATATATAGGMSLLTNIFAWFDEDNDPLMKVAKSMVEISKTLQDGNWVGNYPKLEWASGVGTALTLFAGATVVAGGSSLIKDIFAWFSNDSNPLNTLALSMVEISKTIQGGNWGGNYPKYDWALGVGTALTLFAGATVVAGGGSLVKELLAWFSNDEDPLLNLAKSMVEISKVIQNGKYDNFPNKPYLDGFSYFTTTVSKLIDKYSLDADDAKDFLDSTLIIAPAINKWIEIISKGEFKNAPTKNYSENISSYILSIGDTVKRYSSLDISLDNITDFGKSVKELIPVIKNLKDIPDIGASSVKNMQHIRETLNILVSGIDDFMYEGRGGISGMVLELAVGKKKRSMEDFLSFAQGLNIVVTSLQVLGTLSPIQPGFAKGILEFFKSMKEMPELNSIDSKSNSIAKLANSFTLLADSLKSVNSNLQGFANLSKGLLLISIIDEVKFENVLKTIDKYKATLQVINQTPAERQTNLLTAINGDTKTTPITDIERNESLNKEEDDIDKDQKKFYNDIADIKSLLYDFKDYLDQPSQSGSYYK